MNKKLDNVSPTNPGDFAEAVCALYKHSTKRESEPFRGNVSIEVRRAAFGLALIRNLLDACARSISLSADIPASGIREAYAILDHLTAGRKHPISRHIDGIHSGKYRPQHAPGNAIEREGQKIVVGVVRAYMIAACVLESEALRKTIAAAAERECNFTVDQIKGWSKKFSQENDQGPDYYAATLSKAGDAPQILALGATWIWKWWGAPMPPTEGEKPASVESPRSGPSKRA